MATDISWMKVPHAYLIVAVLLSISPGFAIAQNATPRSDPDLERSARTLSLIHRDIRFYERTGDKLRVLELKEKAQKEWKKAMALSEKKIAPGRRADQELQKIKVQQRNEAAIDAFEAGLKGGEAAWAARDFVTRCGTPVTCLLALNEGKAAIEKAFESADSALQSTVHRNISEYADTLQKKNESQRQAIESQSRALPNRDALIDYSQDASSNASPPAAGGMSLDPSAPVRMGGEPVGAIEDPSAAAAQKRLDTFMQRKRDQEPIPSLTPAMPTPTPIAADLDAARTALESQGQAAKRENNAQPRPQATDRDFSDQFSEQSRETFSRLDDSASRQAEKADAAARTLERRDQALRKTLNETQDRVDSLRAPSPPPTTPGSAGQAQLPMSSKEGPSPAPSPSGKEEPQQQHCPNGAFVCPNGNPWPKCTHPEKYDCPPAEFAEQARQERAKQPRADPNAPETPKSQ